jgi:hypothetical protein
MTTGELLVGSELPRIWTRPLVELTRATSLGYACIDFAERVLCMRLFPWQRWLLVHLLERRPGGGLRFRTAILIVARQAGKTTIDEVIALFFMYALGRALVIGTAQSLDIAEESWQATVDLAESTPELAAEIARVDKTSGKKTLRLVTGERYKVAAVVGSPATSCYSTSCANIRLGRRGRRSARQRSRATRRSSSVCPRRAMSPRSCCGTCAGSRWSRSRRTATRWRPPSCNSASWKPQH